MDNSVFYSEKKRLGEIGSRAGRPSVKRGTMKFGGYSLSGMPMPNCLAKRVPRTFSSPCTLFAQPRNPCAATREHPCDLPGRPCHPSVIRMAVGENDRLQGAWHKLLALLQGLGGPVQIVARIDQDIAMLRVLIIPKLEEL